jgi:hypothetical protein
MNAFWRVFRTWFISLMVLFLIINLIGFVCGFGEAKRVTAGFPWLIAEWIRIGEYRESNYFPSAIMPNAVVAVLVSLSLASLCALSHHKASCSSNTNDTRNDEKQEPEGLDPPGIAMD